MEITFFETFGDPEVDGECTTLREGIAVLTVPDDTLLNGNADQSRCRINECDYVLSGPTPGAVWLGTVNPDTRRQRDVRFMQLKRADGAPTSPRIVLLDGHLQRGEAVLDTRSSHGAQSVEREALVCFTHGCRILTAFGDLPVQELRVGDLVHTVDHGLQPIRWIGSRELSRTRLQIAQHLQPVKISKDALGPGLPAEDIWVSQDHQMLLEGGPVADRFGVDGALAAAKTLVNGRSIAFDPSASDTRYVHLMFDEHQLVFADGAPSESFYPCPSSLRSLTAQDRAKVFDIIPRLENHPMSYGPMVRRAAPVHVAQAVSADLAA